MEQLIAKDNDGGISQVWRLSYPLIIATASATVMQFVNRMFLSWYSKDALAACVPAGILSFTMISFFMGMASYTNVFVAQFHGAKKYARVSVSLWQGIWLALFSWVVVALLIPVGIFAINSSHHSLAVKELEKIYFSALVFSGGLVSLNAALVSFFTGRSLTKVTMTVSIIGNMVNVLLSWMLIFGKGPFPALGILGAALALITGNIVMCGIYFSLILSAENRRRYRTSRLWRFNLEYFKRLVKYGVPSGVGFLLDIASFTLFVFLIGNLDEYSLAANNIVLSINMLAFMPILGIGVAAQTLMGQYMGAQRPDKAIKSVWSAVKLAVIYTGAIGLLFFFLPGMFVKLFGAANAAEYPVIFEKTYPLMRVLSLFVMFDALNIVFGDAIKGAGDTRYQMSVSMLCAWCLFVPGVYYLTTVAAYPAVYAWLWGAFYVALLALIFYWRFRSNKWQKIKLTA